MLLMSPKSPSFAESVRSDAAGLSHPAPPPLRFAVTRRAQIVPVLNGRITGGAGTSPRWLRLRLPVLATFD
jgi:hypothetical protein